MQILKILLFIGHLRANDTTLRVLWVSKSVRDRPQRTHSACDIFFRRCDFMFLTSAALLGLENNAPFCSWNTHVTSKVESTSMSTSRLRLSKPPCVPLNQDGVLTLSIQTHSKFGGQVGHRFPLRDSSYVVCCFALSPHSAIFGLNWRLFYCLVLYSASTVHLGVWSHLHCLDIYLMYMM